MTRKEFEELKFGDMIAANCDNYNFTNKSMNWTGMVTDTDLPDESITASTVTPETMQGIEFGGLFYENFDVVKEI